MNIFYSPNFERHIWYYKHANADIIYKATEGFDRYKVFLDKTTYEKSFILKKTILDIMSTFIPSKIVTTDDRDPPWINNKSKILD